MSTSHVDRNLLFGILALQMDFISRDALIAAMHAWVLNKQKPLGQILVEQGALAPDAQAVLDALVKKHLELHHGDPQQSLAAVGLPGPVHRDLNQFADPDVKASLVHLAAIAPMKTSEQTTLPMGEKAPADARFEILRSHAWGGLGEVYVAQDREVNREVALKRLHERYADDADSRARFLREAEITGGLEHPGIVPVYGLGVSEGGRPYYAMRFIRGQTLKEAIERFHSADARTESQRRIELRQLLGRFIAVCNAVEYAHSRGVIHRDLKPSNIMLGKYGETLVVDWGLCKALGHREPEAATDEHTLLPSSGSGSSETLPGSAIGTPAYMSPEQSEGRIEDMGPASDVYSLGATLYTILTGKEPFDSTIVGVLLGKVQTGDFAPPRVRNPSVSRALDAICLKAMSLLPKDRYPSCAALASDIEHWLADEPVTALRDPLSDRAIRWIKRHRVLAAASAAILVAAFVSLVIGTMLLGRANSQIRDAVTEARGQRDEARQQRQRAEENFRQTRQAIDRYFTLISESRLTDVPGAAPLRKELLSAALEYYEKFTKAESDDAGVQAELAAACFRMAQIRSVTGAGDWFPTYKQGLDIVERLIASKTPIDKFKSLETGIFDVAGQQPHVDPQFVPDLKKALERSIAIWEKLVSMRPKSKGLRNDLAAMYLVLGFLKKDSSLQSKGQDIMAKLKTEFPDEPRFRVALLEAVQNQSDPSLERSLADRDAGVRVAAAQRLWNMSHKPDRVLPALVGCLGDTDAANRTAAAKALGKIGPGAKNALAALRPLLDDPVSEVRVAVVDAVMKIGPGAKDADALRPLLDDLVSEVRVAVVDALWKIDRHAMPAPREFRFRVVTTKGQPLPGTIVRPWGTRYGGGGWRTLDEKGLRATTTDSQGIARVTLSGNRNDSWTKMLREQEARGIYEIGLRVDHPDHPVWSVFCKVAGEGRIVLSDATTLVIHAHRGNEQVTVEHLYPAFSSPGGDGNIFGQGDRDILADMDWFEKDGALEIHRLDITSQQAPRWLRIVHIPEKGPAWFSDLIDLKPLKGNLVSIAISLKPGVRVDGRLSTAVPRPVQNGTIVAKIVALAKGPNAWKWDATTSIAPDGGFVLDSLPADENLQLIALGDGWVSASPTQAEAKKYAEKHGLPGLMHYVPETGSVYPRLFRLEASVIHPVIAMERTSTCKVTVLDQDGQPIPDAIAAFFPNQMFFNSGGPGEGGSNLGTRFDGLGHVRAQLASKNHSERPEVVNGDYSAKTNARGVAIVSNLPHTGVTGSARPRESTFNVWRDGYQIISNSLHRPLPTVELLPGQTGRVTVRMKRE